MHILQFYSKWATIFLLLSTISADTSNPKRMIRFRTVGILHFRQSYPLEDIDIAHSDNSNHQSDNESMDYVDIPYPQTNESSSSVKIATQQDYVPKCQKSHQRPEIQEHHPIFRNKILQTYPNVQSTGYTPLTSKNPN
jgi:hypothetical protein